MARPSTYSRDAALAIARVFAEGGSLRGACRLIPKNHARLTSWRALHPEFRVLIELAGMLRTLNGALELDPAAVTEKGKNDARILTSQLYAPPGPVRDVLWHWVERFGRRGGPIKSDRVLELSWESDAEEETEE